MWWEFSQGATKVMTCVVGEGEDGVPDAVAHVDVEHPGVVSKCITMTYECE